MRGCKWYAAPADVCSTRGFAPLLCGCHHTSYTTHTVGVGAVVVNEKNEILVVQERTGPAAGRWYAWYRVSINRQ